MEETSDQDFLLYLLLLGDLGVLDVGLLALHWDHGSEEEMEHVEVPWEVGGAQGGEAYVEVEDQGDVAQDEVGVVAVVFLA